MGRGVGVADTLTPRATEEAWWATLRCVQSATMPGRGPAAPPSPERCSVAKGQVKVSKNNKPKLTVKEKFAKKAAKKAAKMK